MPQDFTMPNFTSDKLLEGMREMYNECDRLTKEINPAQRSQSASDPTAGRNRPAADPLNAVMYLLPRGVDRKREMTQMKQDLEGNDPEAKNFWLDTICDFREDMDFSKLDLTNPYHVEKAQAACFIHHAMPALHARNSDYFDKRYPDPSTKLGIALLGESHEKFDQMMASMAFEAKEYDYSDLWQNIVPIPVEVAKQQLTSSVANYKIQGFGDTFTSVPYTMTENCKRLANQDINKIKAPNPKERDLDIELHKELANAFGKPIVSVYDAERVRLSRDDLVLIDGRSVNEIINEKNLELTPEQRALTGSKIIAAALTSGKNRVDAVYMHTEKDGSLKPILQNIKPDLKSLGDTTKQDYNWFHRHLYNYGSHKCLTRAQKQDELYSKPTPPKVAKTLQSSMDYISVTTEKYNEEKSRDRQERREFTQRKATSAKMLKDEMAPTTTTAARDRRTVQQQPTQKQTDKVM